MTIPLFTQYYPRNSVAFLQLVHDQVSSSLQEDMGAGDLTAQLIAESQTAQATIISREAAVLCGTDWFNACFQQLDPHIKIKWNANEGDTVQANQQLCEIYG